MSNNKFTVNLGKRVDVLEQLQNTTVATDITKSYVPSYIYEYAHYSNLSTYSCILHIKLRNISSNQLTLNGYQIWISFKDENGNTLAKPGQNTAFDAEITTNISSPNNTINVGDEYSYIIKLDNIGKELDDNNITSAKFWSIGFRQDLAGSGITNVYQNNAILSYQITIIPNNK